MPKQPGNMESASQKDGVLRKTMPRLRVGIALQLEKEMPLLSTTWLSATCMETALPEIGRAQSHGCGEQRGKGIENQPSCLSASARQGRLKAAKRCQVGVRDWHAGDKNAGLPRIAKVTQPAAEVFLRRHL